MKRFYLKIFAAIFISCLGGQTYAQTQDSYQYQSEFVWGINKNTSGGLIGGFIFKKSRKRTERTLETFGLEIMNVKNPQEVRVTSNTGNFFLLGKSNYLYSFRFQYGRDLILFYKGPQQGAEVKAIVAAGPSLGVVAPYYVEYSVDNSGSYANSAPYSSAIPISSIMSTGRLFQGIGESKIVPGVNVKLAFNFEIGTNKSQVTGFEAGFLLDAYTQKIEIMDVAKNYSVYPTLFITLFYGSRK